MSRQVGTRVGALMDITGGTARLFGYGVYEGDFPFGDVTSPTPVGDVFEHIAKGSGIPNPRIKLDNGKVVWGCECWWGPEDQIKRKLAGLTVQEVDIDEIRKQYAEAN